MALKKCPKCEINYIRGEAEYCDVCARAMKRVAAKRIHEDEEEELEEGLLCSECGEAPAVKGHELCHECLREQKRQQELENAEALDSLPDEDDEPEEPEEDA